MNKNEIDKYVNNLKGKANEYFSQQEYERAIEFYTKAIQLDQQNTILYSNRGLAYKKLNNLKDSKRDSKLAIKYDSENIKANLLYGQILIEYAKQNKNLKQIDKGISKIQLALEISTDNNEIDLKSQIKDILLRAKKIKFLLNNEIQIQQNSKIINHIKNISKQNEKSSHILDFLSQSFKSSNSYKDLDIPDFLCCKITFDLMKDPYVTSCGISYEKNILLDHINQNGNFDPVTRKTITYYVPNIALKQYIQQFLHKNPWAFESYQQDYNQIIL